jgi:hypothetical protein
VTNPRPLPPHRPTVGGPAASSDYPRPADTRVPAEAPLVDERYMGWMLGADALGLVPLVNFMVKPERPYYALPSLLLPPLVHVAHGEVGKAAGSLAMRGAMLAVVYAAGRNAENECDGQQFICYPFGSFMIANLAIVTVVVIDSTLLARRRRPDSTWSRMRMLPTVSSNANGDAVLGVAGRF